MSTSLLRPSSTAANSGVAVTGASAHVALNDNSDATYVDSIGTSDVVALALDNFSQPAGSVIKSVAWRLRAGTTGSGTETIVVQLLGLGPAATTLILGGTRVIYSAPILAPSDSDIDAATLAIGQGSAGNAVKVYEAYVDVVYVAKPVTVPSVTPASTVTTTNRPTISWANSLDSDGLGQTNYQVRTFTAAVYGGGGFDPATSTAVDEQLSGLTSTSYAIQVPLPDATYRSYVRVAQTVNGVTHWSDWANVQYVIDVDLPAAPTLTLTAQSSSGRVKIQVADNAGTATTTELEVQRSLDAGVTWQAVRLLTDTAGVLYSTTDATLYDYEAPNGTAMEYRARALHNYSGVYAAGAWATGTVTWSSEDSWLKCPVDPSLNMVVSFPEGGIPGYTRPMRQGVFQPLGRTDPVIVTDKRLDARGSLTFDVSTTAKQALIDALLDSEEALLLQCPAAYHWTDRYLRFGDLERTRWTPKAYSQPVGDALPWWEVPSPVGVVAAWPA